jgi:hypothetical protein
VQIGDTFAEALPTFAFLRVVRLRPQHFQFSRVVERRFGAQILCRECCKCFNGGVLCCG